MTRSEATGRQVTPATAAGRALLNDLEVLWGKAAWTTFPWHAHVEAIEAEARQPVEARLAEAERLLRLMVIAAAPAPALDVERLARAIHAEHGMLVFSAEHQDLKTGKWHAYTHAYCLKQDMQLAAPLAAAYAAAAGEEQG